MTSLELICDIIHELVVIQVYGDCLSQAVFVAYCEAFPDSDQHFQNEFKETVTSLINEWVSGIYSHICSSFIKHTNRSCCVGLQLHFVQFSYETIFGGKCFTVYSNLYIFTTNTGSWSCFYRFAARTWQLVQVESAMPRGSCNAHIHTTEKWFWEADSSARLVVLHFSRLIW